MFDENLYQETISALHASEDTLSEVMNMTHKTKRRGRLRTTAVLAAVIAILCCMAAAAAALGLDQRLPTAIVRRSSSTLPRRRGQYWIRTTTHSIGACPQRPGTE